MAIRVVQHNVLTFRHIWRSYLGSLLGPLVFLVAVGAGVGTLVDAGELGMPYLTYLAPGLIVGAAVQTGSLAGFGPIMGRIRWDPIYESMLHAPLRIRDVLAGEMLWIVLRLTVGSLLFFTAMLVLDVVASPWTVLCVPVAVLCGLSFAALFTAIAGHAPNGYTYDVLSRVVVIPLFLFGGVFFPVDRLPWPLRVVVELTPVPHATSLARATLTGPPAAGLVLVFLAVAATYTAGALLVAHRAFRKRLTS